VEFDDSALLRDIARAGLARAGAGDWSLESGPFWCTATPPAHVPRTQGWKLHVSSTQLSAPLILSRAVDILGREQCAFKFAATLDRLAVLLSNQCARGGGGKFITVYPDDDAQLRRLAGALDEATDGLPGPIVLSDRPWRPGSRVSYRFGVFRSPRVLTDGGVFESMLTAPSGEHEVDRREPWFSPPDWVTMPAPESPSTVDSDGAVLIGGRFEVRGAIRHSYRGGVFLAVDRDSGAEVVLKQARPHVLGGLTGADARDALRHEARMLDELAPLGVAPHGLGLFEQQENLFLAEERVPGVALRDWVARRVTGSWRGAGAPRGAAVPLARRLVELVAAVHARGLVLRDLNPNNVMITPRRRVRLVDLEHAVALGARVPTAYTRGYASPEQLASPWYGPAPAASSDLYSLGATLAYLFSGLEICASGPDRVGELLESAGSSMPALRRVTPLLSGLLQESPHQRWSLERAQDFLRHVPALPRQSTVDTDRSNGGIRVTVRPATDDPDTVRPAVSEPGIDGLVVDGVRFLLESMTPDGATLWPGGAAGAVVDPCAVQFGAAGPLAVLTRAARTVDVPGLRAGLVTAARWVSERAEDIPRFLPGLYFGRTGTAWALYDAGMALEDSELADWALALARRTPVVSAHPDVTHGIAGAGMAYLHLAAATGEAEWSDRARTVADGLLAGAGEDKGRLVWPIPDTVDSGLAGQTYYGFAHGVAGIGNYLLACARATGRSDYLDTAVRSGETLLAVSDVDGGAAWWPTGPGPDPAFGERRRHWCNGSAGVGAFLTRLAAAVSGQVSPVAGGGGRWRAEPACGGGDGGQRFADLADAAARAVHRDAWYSGAAYCHGLPSDGDLLLDLADLTGERRYRDRAAELATILYRRHTVHNGLTVGTDGPEVTAAFGTGVAGVLAFLLRLRDRGARMWMCEPAQSDDKTGVHCGQ
jgi:hypothetical protein